MQHPHPVMYPRGSRPARRVSRRPKNVGAVSERQPPASTDQFYRARAGDHAHRARRLRQDPHRAGDLVWIDWALRRRGLVGGPLRDLRPRPRAAGRGQSTEHQGGAWSIPDRDAGAGPRSDRVALSAGQLRAPHRRLRQARLRSARVLPEPTRSGDQPRGRGRDRRDDLAGPPALLARPPQLHRRGTRGLRVGAVVRREGPLPPPELYVGLPQRSACGGDLPPSRRNPARHRARRGEGKDFVGGPDLGPPRAFAEVALWHGSRRSGAAANLEGNARLELLAARREGKGAVCATLGVRGRLHARSRGGRRVTARRQR